MSALVHPRMTADELIAWAMEQPEGKRYELAGGEVIAMAPERVGHGRSKLRFARRFAETIEAAALPCEVFVGCLSVRVDAATIYEPDTTMRYGPPPDAGVTVITDPLIVVEVFPRRRTSTIQASSWRTISVFHRCATI